MIKLLVPILLKMNYLIINLTLEKNLKFMHKYKIRFNDVRIVS